MITKTAMTILAASLAATPVIPVTAMAEGECQQDRQKFCKVRDEGKRWGLPRSAHGRAERSLQGHAGGSGACVACECRDEPQASERAK